MEPTYFTDLKVRWYHLKTALGACCQVLGTAAWDPQDREKDYKVRLLAFTCLLWCMHTRVFFLKDEFKTVL